MIVHHTVWGGSRMKTYIYQLVLHTDRLSSLEARLAFQWSKYVHLKRIFGLLMTRAYGKVIEHHGANPAE